MEDLLKKEIADWFINSWTKKEFPKDLKIKNYEEARKFRMYWIENWKLTLQSAIDKYINEN